MVRRVLHPLTQLATFFVLLVASSQALAAEGETTTPVVAPIVGGDAVDSCGWPSVVGFGYCSGTLIHPRVVVSAAHCLHDDRATTVRFGENANRPAREVAVESCTSYAGFDDNFGDGVDWAFCILEEAVTDVPIVPPLMGCELDALMADDAEAVLVGFGRDDDGKSGTKRAVTVPVHEVAGGEAVLGGEGQAGCFGDSGGPSFVQVADGSWRVFGIISYALGSCGAAEHVSLLSDAMPWLEDTSKFDLTPCTDAYGNWRPSETCRDFPVLADVGEGEWEAEQSCHEDVRLGWSTTCGPAYDPDRRFPPEPTYDPDQSEEPKQPDQYGSDAHNIDATTPAGCSSTRGTDSGMGSLLITLFGIAGVRRRRSA